MNWAERHERRIVFNCNFQLVTKGHFLFLSHTLCFIRCCFSNKVLQNGMTNRLYWTLIFLIIIICLFPFFSPTKMYDQSGHIYWGIWSILHPFCSLNEKSCAFSSTLAEVKNRLWWRCNCMQEDTTPGSITIAQRRQTPLRGSWNAGNRRSSPHQFIYYCIVKVKAKKASQSDYNYISFLQVDEENERKSLNLLCICFRKL